MKSSSSMSLADSRHFSQSANSLKSATSQKTGNSPSLSRKSSVRSMSADKVFENDVKGKMKKASSRTSLVSVLESE